MTHHVAWEELQNTLLLLYAIPLKEREMLMNELTQVAGYSAVKPAGWHAPQRYQPIRNRDFNLLFIRLHHSVTEQLLGNILLITIILLLLQ